MKSKSYWMLTMLVACGGAAQQTTQTSPQTKPTETASDTTSAPTTSASSCTIGGKPFKPVMAKREDDPDDDAVRVFIFATKPGSPAEEKALCDRATPLPAFAVKADGRLVEVDFNDAKNLTGHYDVLFLTHTEGSSYNHDGAESGVAELTGKGASQKIHVKAKTDDADCELTVPVTTCPSPSP
jgi:hypothetical protein